MFSSTTVQKILYNTFRNQSCPTKPKHTNPHLRTACAKIHSQYLLETLKTHRDSRGQYIIYSFIHSSASVASLSINEAAGVCERGEAMWRMSAFLGGGGVFVLNLLTQSRSKAKGWVEKLRHQWMDSNGSCLMLLYHYSCHSLSVSFSDFTVKPAQNYTFRCLGFTQYLYWRN